MGREIRYGLSSLIQDGSITGAKLADGAVTNVKVNASAAIDGSKLNTPVAGGNGADGALAITSGTTTIDLAGALILEKNYTSISITGTGQLAFINPHNNGTTIILRSQGAVTITSSATPAIEASYLGAKGGTSLASSLALQSGSQSQLYLDSLVHAGTSTGGGVAVATRAFYATSLDTISGTSMRLPLPGSGGSSGGSADATTGMNGGRGGAGLLIECGGAWNFTGTIYARGQVGQGTPGGQQSASGGGAGGSVIVLYGSLTASSGTILVTGGNGAGAGQGQAPSGTGGANLVAGGTAGVAGTNDTGTGGTAGGGYGGGGGGGAGGYYLIAKNR